MNETTTRDSFAIAQVQKTAAHRKRSSVKRDAEEFRSRHSELSWQSDGDTSRCTKCNVKFTLTNRKRKLHCGETLRQTQPEEVILEPWEDDSLDLDPKFYEDTRDKAPESLVPLPGAVINITIDLFI